MRIYRHIRNRDSIDLGIWLLQRYKRRREADRRQTLQEQTLFSHKANPMYDTTQTLTTTSSSARGDDFEVIRVPPGPTETLAPRQTLYPADPSRVYMPPVYTVGCFVTDVQTDSIDNP